MHTVYIYVCLHLQIHRIRFFLGQHYKSIQNAAPLDLKTLCNIPVLPRNAPFNIVSDDRSNARADNSSSHEARCVHSTAFLQQPKFVIQ